MYISMILKYEIVKKELLNLIKDNKSEKGFKLPTEHELMEAHGYSRNTIRQAISELETEGIVYRVHGKGTFFRRKSELSSEPRSSSQSKGFIGLVSFYFLDYIYPEIMRGIEDVIYEKGYSLVLSNCNQDHDKELESVQRFIDQGVKGLILEPSRNSEIDKNHPLIKLLEKADIPVITTHWNPLNEAFSMVTVDDKKAGYEATKYLIEMGHRNIGIVYKSDVQAGAHRFEGYRKALKDFGIPVNEKNELPFSDAEEQGGIDPGYLLTMEMLHENPDKPTAIFYFNDRIAYSGYKAIKELGLRIPEDISVIGYDNFDTSALMDPPMTTFEHPKYTLGHWSAHILLEEIESSHRTLPMNLFFKPVLVERSSVIQKDQISR